MTEEFKCILYQAWGRTLKCSERSARNALFSVIVKIVARTINLKKINKKETYGYNVRRKHNIWQSISIISLITFP